MTGAEALTIAGITGLILILLASLAVIAIGYAVIVGIYEDHKKKRNRKNTPIIEGPSTINSDDSIFFAVEEAQRDLVQ